MSNEQNIDHVAHVVVRLVGDRGLHQNVGKVPNETVHRSANEVARRLMEINDEGRVEIEINGELIEPELIGYWRMLAREAINYPGEYEQLVRSIQRDIA